jgi:hypothetical protein
MLNDIFLISSLVLFLLMSTEFFLLSAFSLIRVSASSSHPGLPDGMFSNQKSLFG